MSLATPIVWSEGLFLRQHHFQQQERYLRHLVRERTAALGAHGWGISALEVDRSLLALGQFGLTRCRAILEDGTPVSIPDVDSNPAPTLLPEAARDRIIYLALPVAQAGSIEVTTGTGTMARYVRDTIEVSDAVEGPPSTADIPIGRLQFRFLVEGNDLSGFVCLGVARVKEVRPGGGVLLDETFMPAATDCSAHPTLAGIVTDTLGLVTHRADALARRLAGNDAVGGAEVTDLLLLAALNRAAALFTHLSEFVGLHPERLFAELVQLAGEIASFTTPTRRNAIFRAYRHTNLEASFRPVIDDLRRSLTSVLDRRAVAIPLTERKYGILTGHIADLSLVGEAQFVLVARSSFSAPTIARVLPAQVKVGPTEIIRDLVNSSLPGIGLRALPSAPRVLPFYGNATYFELAADSPLWARMRISGAVALHVAGEFTDLEVELWAIRSP